ncbi:PH domain-containing protein [Candidatus Micrarchaeota archaeon]|nr:PH domain-containing protein [Candidatus Micrarchaeota archaeon]
MDDEKILWEGKPSMKTILGKTIGLIVLFGLIYVPMWIGMFTNRSSNNTMVWVLSIGFFIIPIILGIIYNYLLVKSYKYKITTDDVISEGGVFFKFKRRVPYHKITDTNIKQGPIDQLLGIYTFSIQTAGTGYKKSEITFIGLLNPNKPEEIIQQQIKKVQKTSE